MRTSDKVSTKTLLNQVGLLSINQTHAQIKLLEMWKAINITGYPIRANNTVRGEGIAVTRSSGTNQLQESGISVTSQKTCINHAKYIWNQAPISIKNCTCLYAAKAAIKQYAKTLPI